MTGLGEAVGKGERAAGGAGAAPRSPGAPQHPPADPRAPQQGERSCCQEAGPRRRGALGEAAHLGTSSSRLPGGEGAGEWALCPDQAPADPGPGAPWVAGPDTAVLARRPRDYGPPPAPPAAAFRETGRESGLLPPAQRGAGWVRKAGPGREVEAEVSSPRPGPPRPRPSSECSRRSAANLSQPSPTEPPCTPQGLLLRWRSRVEPRPRATAVPRGQRRLPWRQIEVSEPRDGGEATAVGVAARSRGRAAVGFRRGAPPTPRPPPGPDEMVPPADPGSGARSPRGPASPGQRRGAPGVRLTPTRRWPVRCGPLRAHSDRGETPSTRSSPRDFISFSAELSRIFQEQGKFLTRVL